MDFKTILTSAAVSIAATVVTAPLIVNYVSLQATTPGTVETGHSNISGYSLASRFGAGTSPTLARVQINESGSAQGLRAVTGTGVAVYGQSNATTGLGAGGYFTSASAGGRALVAEQYSASGNTVAGLFMPYSPDGIGVWGRHNPTTGTKPGVLGDSASTDGSAIALQGTISSTSPGGFSTAVRGNNNGTGGLGIGVYGSQNGSGWGVYGTTPSGLGVYGNSNAGFAVYGSTSSGVGGAFRNSAASGSADLASANGAVYDIQGGIYKAYTPSSHIPCVPVAWGVVSSSGTVYNAGSGNWSSTQDSTGTYTIDVAGVSWNELNYAFTASTNDEGLAPSVVSRTSTGAGDLTLKVVNLSGTTVNRGVHFVIYATSFAPQTSPPHSQKVSQSTYNSNSDFDHDPKAQAWLRKKMDEYRKQTQAAPTFEPVMQGSQKSSRP